MKWGLPAVRYRLRQLRSSLGVRLSPQDREWVDSLLTPAERELYYRMPSYDQTHSAAVARDVQRAGGPDLLLRAALLHDCGKTVPPHRVPLLYRGLVVLLRTLSPALLPALARRWGPFWPIYLHVHHAELSARELRSAGSPPMMVEWARHHEEPTSDPLLCRLQWADNRH